MSKDATENRLEEWPDVFVDIFNNLILDGHGTLKAEELTAMTTRAYKRKNDGELQSGMRDVRKMACGNSGFRLICALENQTGIDHTMPERIMGYEYAGYEEQVKELMDENVKKKRSAGSKRIFHEQKLSPIVTGVLYFGDRKWKMPRSLHEMMQFPKGMEDLLKQYVADYPMNIVHVAHLTEEERGEMVYV